MRVHLLLAFILSLGMTLSIPTTGQVGQQTYNFDSEQVPILIAPYDLSRFSIIDSRIFPITTLDIDSINQLGKAFITWTFDIEGKSVGFFAIYNRGQLVNFTQLPELFDRLDWFAVGEQLFVIGINNADTTLYIYSTGGQRLFSYTTPGGFENHKVFAGTSQVFLYAKDTRDDFAYYFKFFIDQGIIRFDTTERILDTMPGVAIVKVSDTEKRLYNNAQLATINTTLPIELSDNLSIGHLKLDPSVFDLDNHLLWNPTFGFADLPKNSSRVHFYGLQSSIVETQNGSLFEYSEDHWVEVGAFNGQLFDFSLVDIGTYIGTTTRNGLALYTSGYDEDKDSIPDTMEDYYGGLPFTNDTDGDGMSDALEIAYGTLPQVKDNELDYDGDRLTNEEELALGLNPLNPDSDYGGALDGWELEFGLDPYDMSDDMLDFDNDGILNDVESIWRSDPRSNDTDSDGLPDWWEIFYYQNPANASNANEDPDGDGYSNVEEYELNTDPLLKNPKTILEGFWIYIGVIFVISILPTMFIIRVLVKSENTLTETVE